MRFIDDIPLPVLILFAVLMLGAPFVPEPQLVEKARMPTEGSLTRPIDIFDAFRCLPPCALWALRLARMRRTP